MIAHNIFEFFPYKSEYNDIFAAPKFTIFGREVYGPQTHAEFSIGGDNSKSNMANLQPNKLVTLLDVTY